MAHFDTLTDDRLGDIMQVPNAPVELPLRWWLWFVPTECEPQVPPAPQAIYFVRARGAPVMKAVLMVFGLLLTAGSIFAHHNFLAEFDPDKPIKLTGTVTKLEWTNPHTWFYLDVKDEAGAITNWAMEMGSPNSLMRAGWTRSSMKIGEVVIVEGFLARDKPNVGNARVVTLASTGQRLFAASSQGQ